MNGAEIVGSTTDPAFAVDARGKVAAWNKAAERFFGYPASQIVDQRCWEVLQGKDIFGNDYCNESCPLLQMALRQRAVHPCHLVFGDAQGSPARVRVALISTPIGARTGWRLVHLVSESTPCEAPFETPIGTSNSLASRLTAREVEVLTLLGQGCGTRRTADTLSLSLATVRNHVQHILHKLRVHSRLEAVALARRLGLLD